MLEVWSDVDFLLLFSQEAKIASMATRGNFKDVFIKEQVLLGLMYKILYRLTALGPIPL